MNIQAELVTDKSAEPDWLKGYERYFAESVLHSENES